MTNANTTDTELGTGPLEDSILDEQNVTEDESWATAEQIEELQVDAGKDVVAQSGDTVVLKGAITGVDPESEGLTL